MHSFKALVRWVADSYTARDMRHRLLWAGLGLSWDDCDMLCKNYLRHESAEYVVAAALAIQQVGE